MLSSGTLLQGRYRIVRQLAKGGMGTVYEVIDQRLDTTFALKETSYFNNETLRRQFEREARLLARLNHPALPHVTDHFIEEEGQFPGHAVHPQIFACHAINRGGKFW